MIALLFTALAADPAQPSTPPPSPPAALSEVAHAIDAGRLDQARLMIAKSVEAGVKAPQLDRLMADLAFATGDYKNALARYQQLLVGTGDAVMYERAGISAFKVGAVVQAARLLERATSFQSASWKAWNARGVAADYLREWAVADEAYARAAAVAPQRAEIHNNLGWSLLARGRWNEALPHLEEAAALDPKSVRIAANLELARAAVSRDLPQRRPGETDEAWSARLNDAGVLASLQGDKAKAKSAFAQAIESRSSYYSRAANNLAMVDSTK